MSKKIGYVIQEVNFEYNDEVYSRGGGGGSPQNIYFNEDKARQACDLLNLERLKETAKHYRGLTEYSYEPDEVMGRGWEEYFKDYMNPDAAIESINDWREEADKLFAGLSDDEWVRMLPFLKLDFYEVYEVAVID